MMGIPASSVVDPGVDAGASAAVLTSRQDGGARLRAS